MSGDLSKTKDQAIPLCVDLDGTLSRTDTLLEQIFWLLRKRPLKLISLIVALAKGRVFFKKKTAEQSDFLPIHIPYNNILLEGLKKEHAVGRNIYLVTGSHVDFAKKVADHLAIFKDVYGSCETNLVGKEKAKLLVETFGEKKFDYIGNASVDIAIWKKSRKGILVKNNRFLLKKAQKFAQVEPQFVETEIPILINIVKQIRVHQWAKNILIFLPMILSHSYNNANTWLTCIAAMLSFAFLSSCVYLLNDVLDLEADRQHPENKDRPFAAGSLSLVWLFILLPLLLVLSGGLASQLSHDFIWVLGGYFALTSLYSIKLKKLPIADILMLALLYAWRVFAGSIATGIELSNWFLTFSIFFFFSLALVKRCAELQLLRTTTGSHNTRRGYRLDDLVLLQTFGIASGYLSVLVLALYLNDPMLTQQKLNPGLLWLICPLLLYWLSRLWLAAFRGNIPSDPMIFALKDNQSYFIIVLISILWLAAKGF